MYIAANTAQPNAHTLCSVSGFVQLYNRILDPFAPYIAGYLVNTYIMDNWFLLENAPRIDPFIFDELDQSYNYVATFYEYVPILLQWNLSITTT